MPRKNRPFTNNNLTRACRNLAPAEQVKIVHDLLEKDCFPIEFTPDQVEKIICQPMEVSARRRLMKRLITESQCNGENKIISCQAIGALKTAIDALTKPDGPLDVLAALLPLLRTLSWLVRAVVWLEPLFTRIGVVEKYLEAMALPIVALGEFFDYLNELCEEPPSTAGIDTSALNDDLPELIAEAIRNRQKRGSGSLRPSLDDVRERIHPKKARNALFVFIKKIFLLFLISLFHFAKLIFVHEDTRWRT